MNRIEVEPRLELEDHVALFAFSLSLTKIAEIAGYDAWSVREVVTIGRFSVVAITGDLPVKANAYEITLYRTLRATQQRVFASVECSIEMIEAAVKENRILTLGGTLVDLISQSIDNAQPSSNVN